MATTNKTSLKRATSALKFIHTEKGASYITYKSTLSSKKIKQNDGSTSIKYETKLTSQKNTKKSSSHTNWLKMYALVSRTEEKYDSNSDYEVQVWFENRGSKDLSDKGTITVKMGGGDSSRKVKTSTVKNVNISLKGRKIKDSVKKNGTTSVTSYSYYSTSKNPKKVKFSFNGEKDDKKICFYINYKSSNDENQTEAKKDVELIIGKESCGKKVDDTYKITLPKNDEDYTYSYYTTVSNSDNNHSQNGYVVELTDENLDLKKAKTISGSKIDSLSTVSTYKTKIHNKLANGNPLVRYGTNTFKLGVIPSVKITVSSSSTILTSIGLSPKADNYFWTKKWYAKKAGKVYSNTIKVAHNVAQETYHPIFCENMLCVRYAINPNNTTYSANYQVVKNTTSKKDTTTAKAPTYGYLIPKKDFLNTNNSKIIYSEDMKRFNLVPSGASTTARPKYTYKNNEPYNYGQQWGYSKTNTLLKQSELGIKREGYDFKGFTAKAEKTDVISVGENGITGKQLANSIDKILKKYADPNSTTTTTTITEKLQKHAVAKCTLYPIWAIKEYNVRIDLKDGVRQEDQQSFTKTCSYKTTLDLAEYKAKAHTPEGTYLSGWTVNRINTKTNEKLSGVQLIKLAPSAKFTFNKKEKTNADGTTAKDSSGNVIYTDDLQLINGKNDDSLIIFTAIWEPIPFKFTIKDHFQVRYKDISKDDAPAKIVKEDRTLSNVSIHGQSYYIDSILTFDLIRDFGTFVYSNNKPLTLSYLVKDQAGVIKNEVVGFGSYSLINCTVNGNTFETFDTLKLSADMGVLKTKSDESMYRLIIIERSFYYAPEPIYATFQFNEISLNLPLQKNNSKYSITWNQSTYQNDFYWQSYEKLYNAGAKNSKLEKNGYLFLGWKLMSSDKTIDSLITDHYILKNGLMVKFVKETDLTTVINNLDLGTPPQDPIIIAIPQYLELDPVQVDTSGGHNTVYSYRALVLQSISLGQDNTGQITYYEEQKINRGYSLMKENLDDKYVVNKKAVETGEDPLLKFTQSPIKTWLEEDKLKISFDNGLMNIEINGQSVKTGETYNTEQRPAESMRLSSNFFNFKFDKTNQTLEVRL